MLMKAMIEIDKITKAKGIEPVVRQPSRCFLSNFIKLLYVMHGAILQNVYQARNIDLVEDYIQGWDNCPDSDHISENLAMCGLPGECSGWFDTLLWDWRYRSHNGAIYGEHTGIVLGIGTIAVTPTDCRLDRMCGHGTRAPDGADAQFENYTTGDDNDNEIYGTKVYGIAFTPKRTHRVSEVRVKIWREGNPGDATVRILGMQDPTIGAMEPPEPTDWVNNVIAEGTIPEASVPVGSPGNWVTCTLSTQGDVYAGRRYFIVISGGVDVANSIHWRFDDNDATYLGGEARSTDCYNVYSGDNGVNWSAQYNDCHMFDERGRSPGEFEIGGSELIGLQFVNPNGEFTMRRYFTNNCGASITINEVGIIAVACNVTDAGADDARVTALLVARDVLGAGVAVNHGEILRVTYVPQRTV